jgi:hypothetical protein
VTASRHSPRACVPWNAVRNGGGRSACLAALARAAASASFPWAAAASWSYMAGPISRYWACSCRYKLFLMRMHGSGDFSETRAIARGSSPMLVALGVAAVASEWLDWIAALGILRTGGGIVSRKDQCAVRGAHRGVG